MERVLLTGISGFLGGHCALQLLEKGYIVRGSVRSASRFEAVRRMLGEAGGDLSRLELVELDLLDDTGWADAAEGCDFLMHVASPFLITMPKDRNDLIRPAIAGTRRAINAALAADHKRMVVTSSIAAIDCGHDDYDRIFTEADWTNVDGPKVNAYFESKARAEREAWSLVDAAGRHDALAVINPGAILGPLLDDDVGTSGMLIQRLLKGHMPLAPDIILSYVDVRDVAAAHVAALTAPDAGGHRHIVTHQDSAPLLAIADALRQAFPDKARKLPKRQMPAWMLAIAGSFDSSIGDGAAYVGIRRRYDGGRCRALLGRELISTADAAVATGRSILERGLA